MNPFLIIKSNYGFLISEKKDASAYGLSHIVRNEIHNNWVYDTIKIGYASNLYSFSIGTDGETVFERTTEGIAIWDFRTQKLKRTINWHVDGMGPIAVSSNSKTIASATYGVVKAWDVETGKEVLSFNLNSATEYSFTSFSPDGKLFLVLGGDSTLVFLNTTTGMEYSRIKINPNEVCLECFPISYDNRFVTSVESDTLLVLWDISTQTKAKYFNCYNQNFISSVAFSPDGRYIATGGGDGTVSLWELESGKLSATASLDMGYVIELAFSSDSRTLAARLAESVFPEESQIYFIDTKSGRLLMKLSKYESTGHAYDQPEELSKQLSGWCAVYVYGFANNGYGYFDGEPDGEKAYTNFIFDNFGYPDGIYKANGKSFTILDFQQKLHFKGLMSSILNRKRGGFKLSAD